DSWSAGKWTMLERQCEPHPADYAPRGPASMRISSTVDPVSHDVVAWQTTMMWMLPQRTIYMDGRPHPSPNAQHTWQGFSTGEWIRETQRGRGSPPRKSDQPPQRACHHR